jgi:hypothetical protein
MMSPLLSWTLFIGVAGAAYVSVFGVPAAIKKARLKQQQEQHVGQGNGGASSASTAAKKSSSGKKASTVKGKSQLPQTAGVQDVQATVKQGAKVVGEQIERASEAAREAAQSVVDSTAEAVNTQSKNAKKKKDGKQQVQDKARDATADTQPSATAQSKGKRSAKVKTASWYNPEAKVEAEDVASRKESTQAGYAVNVAAKIRANYRSQDSTTSQLTRKAGVSFEDDWTDVKQPQSAQVQSDDESEEEDEDENAEASSLHGSRFLAVLPESSKKQHLAGQAFESARRSHITDDMLPSDTSFAARTLKIVPGASASSETKSSKKQKEQPGTLTKKQRQNQAKKAKQQAEKEALRETQDKALKQHLKQRQNERIAELAAQGQAKAPKSSSVWQGGDEWQTVQKKKVSGGQSASVVDGKLIWE